MTPTASTTKLLAKLPFLLFMAPLYIGLLSGPRTVFAQADSITFNDLPYATIISPTTGRVWLDRNLAASRVATASDDASSYGGWYQWGRGNDGHQSNPNATAVQATDIDPGHASFISNPADWITTDPDGKARNAAWADSSANGSGVCPANFKVATRNDFVAEGFSSTITSPQTAFSSFLKLSSAGSRQNDGTKMHQGSRLSYWTGGRNSSGGSERFYANSSASGFEEYSKAAGMSVRCIKVRKSYLFNATGEVPSYKQPTTADTSAVLRYLFGTRGNANLAIDYPATTVDTLALQNLLNENALDVDNSGNTDTKDATMILRYQLGILCNDLTTGLSGTNCSTTFDRIIRILATPGLPPDPGEDGMLTLAGIDSNANDIRDDVEIAIHKRHPNAAPSLMNALMQNAKSTQDTVMAGNSGIVDDLDRASRSQDAAIECLFATMDDAIEELRFIEHTTVNTRARLIAYDSYNAAFDGQFFVIGEIPNPCNQ